MGLAETQHPFLHAVGQHVVFGFVLVALVAAIWLVAKRFQKPSLIAEVVFWGVLSAVSIFLLVAASYK